jgi:superfamily II DNA or RNA helicase
VPREPPEPLAMIGRVLRAPARDLSDGGITHAIGTALPKHADTDVEGIDEPASLAPRKKLAYTRYLFWGTPHSNSVDTDFEAELETGVPRSFLAHSESATFPPPLLVSEGRHWFLVTPRHGDRAVPETLVTKAVAECFLSTQPRSQPVRRGTPKKGFQLLRLRLLRTTPETHPGVYLDPLVTTRQLMRMACDAETHTGDEVLLGIPSVWVQIRAAARESCGSLTTVVGPGSATRGIPTSLAFRVGLRNCPKFPQDCFRRALLTAWARHPPSSGITGLTGCLNTGSGKSRSAAAVVASLGCTAVALADQRDIAAQLSATFQECLGLETAPPIVGGSQNVPRGGKKLAFPRPGAPIVIVMTPTLIQMVKRAEQETKNKGNAVALVREWMRAEDFGTLVVDESHAMGNEASATALDVFARCRYRLFLTATPETEAIGSGFDLSQGPIAYRQPPEFCNMVYARIEWHGDDCVSTPRIRGGRAWAEYHRLSRNGAMLPKPGEPGSEHYLPMDPTAFATQVTESASRNSMLSRLTAGAVIAGYSVLLKSKRAASHLVPLAAATMSELQSAGPLSRHALADSTFCEPRVVSADTRVTTADRMGPDPLLSEGRTEGPVVAVAAAEMDDDAKAILRTLPADDAVAVSTGAMSSKVGQAWLRDASKVTKNALAYFVTPNMILKGWDAPHKSCVIASDDVGTHGPMQQGAGRITRLVSHMEKRFPLIAWVADVRHDYEGWDRRPRKREAFLRDIAVPQVRVVIRDPADVTPERCARFFAEVDAFALTCRERFVRGEKLPPMREIKTFLSGRRLFGAQ